ncbi:MFS transporter [Lacisediminihabitans profunda]|nr:MFS transporter [Lacisediminihabitans profunda]
MTEDAAAHQTGLAAADRIIEIRSIARPATRRLTVWLLIQAFALYGVYGAVAAVLIPNQLSIIDPANKINDFAIIATVFAAVATLSQPLIGAFSDRTRSRFGRRALWMLVGASLGSAALRALSASHSVVAVGLFAAALSLGINSLISPLTATLPDRYAVRRRGGASAMIGAGTMLGATIGSVIAGIMAAQLGVAYVAFAVALLVLTLLFLVLNRDYSSKDLSLERFSARVFIGQFWLSPRKHPEFGWVFLARFLFVLGFSSVSTFTYFLLTDYAGLSLAQANASVGVVGLAALPGMVIAVLLTGFLADRMGRRKIFMWIGSGVMIAGLVVPIVSPTLLGITVMSMMTGFGYGAYQASDVVLMTQVLPNGGSAAGKDLGILNMATGIPTAVAPALAAAVIGTVFGFHGLFVVAGVIVLVGALAIIPVKSVR